MPPIYVREDKVAYKLWHDPDDFSETVGMVNRDCRSNRSSRRGMPLRCQPCMTRSVSSPIMMTLFHFLGSLVSFAQIERREVED